MQRAAIRLVAATAEDARAKLDDWRVAAALSHPHLMRIFTSGQCKVDADEVVYVVTEFAEEALSQVLPERPLTPAEAREMLVPVLDALSHLHGKNLAYGRLKPSKVMVVEDQMKLAVDSLHRVGSLPRPPAALQIYDAPERGTGAISAASDVWSLGVTLVEALTQHPPFWDRSTKSDPVVSGSVPQPFADIARKCLHREPDRRCSLKEIQALLDPAIPLPVPRSEAEGAKQAKSIKPPSKAVEAVRSRRRVSLLIAAMLVLCIVVAVLLLHKMHPSSTAEMKTAVPTAPSPASAAKQAPAAPITATKGLSAKGEVVERVMPDISEGANKSIHGKFAVKVRVSVDAKGDVSKAAFDSRGPSRYFANQALQAAQGWKFKPAQADGRPVASEWILRFEFRRNRTECSPVEVNP